MRLGRRKGALKDLFGLLNAWITDRREEENADNGKNWLILHMFASRKEEN